MIGSHENCSIDDEPVGICVANVELECIASEQEFDLRGKRNSNFPCSIAQSEKTGNIAVSKETLIHPVGICSQMSRSIKKRREEKRGKKKKF